jgi:hypothetical protein
VPSYLVETYLSRPRADERAALEKRAASAARALNAPGRAVRFESSMAVPEDEVCFFVFEAPSGAVARLAAEAAGLGPLRVVEAVTSGEHGT